MTIGTIGAHMKIPIWRVSLALNVLALVAVSGALIIDADRIVDVYGPATPGRAILLSVYLTILLVSALLLWRPDDKMIVTLLLVQVIYKITTPFTVGTLANPVVISNLAIASLHAAAIAQTCRTHPGKLPHQPSRRDTP